MKNYIKSLARVIPGTTFGLLIFLISLPTAIFPLLQILTFLLSLPVYNLVSHYLVKPNSPTKCTDELLFMNIIYISVSAAIAIIFYIKTFIKINGVNINRNIIIFLVAEFLLLQTPFFIWEVGTYYNCETDGQTIMGYIFSSPKVSLVIPCLGILYDILMKFRRRTETGRLNNI
jgi:hypothetical protein